MRSSDPSSCANLFESLPAVVDGGSGGELMSAAERIHLAQCLRCQAEVANYRRLRRSMRELADVGVPVDPTLEHEILLTLDEYDERSGRRVPTYAAATLGGLAAAAGVIALATRQRRGGRLVG
jgi:anti-sigma factor RsiW